MLILLHDIYLSVCLSYSRLYAAYSALYIVITVTFTAHYQNIQFFKDTLSEYLIDILLYAKMWMSGY